MSNLENTPEVLYKYRPWDDNGKKMLRDGEIFFASPRHFNDPFDCKIPARLADISIKQLKESLKISTEQRNPTATPREIKAIVQQKVRQFNKTKENGEIMDRFEQQMLRNLEKTFGLFSLSRTSSNILMWSHYARSHKGFCIGFHTGQLLGEIEERYALSEVATNLFEVQYQDEYPSMRLLPGQERIELLNRMLTVKSDEWSYEKEYRIVLNGETDAAIKIPKSIVAEVILGVNIETDARNEIKVIVEEHYPTAALLQAVKAKDRYAVTLDAINAPSETRGMRYE